jgi:hypothetical protein
MKLRRFGDLAMRVNRALALGLWAGLWISASACAGEVSVVKVTVEEIDGGSFNFAVTLRHADTGWEHYADRWQVLSLNGEHVYGERVLLHPHVEEQPFTRALTNVSVPDGVSEVLVRGHDNVDGWGEPVSVRLPQR